jgi:hypothetical protein
VSARQKAKGQNFDSAIFAIKYKTGTTRVSARQKAKGQNFDSAIFAIKYKTGGKKWTTDIRKKEKIRKMIERRGSFVLLSEVEDFVL